MIPPTHSPDEPQSEVKVQTPRKKEVTVNFSFATHSIGTGLKDTHIARGIFNKCHASVVMVYLNVKTILHGTDDNYYAALKAVLDTMNGDFLSLCLR